MSEAAEESAAILAARSGRDVAAWRAAMAHEEQYGAYAALGLGLVDEIV
jgi:hypothetical protein